MGELDAGRADTGIYVPPGGSFAYQMHYTSIGKPVTDATEVGYYFHKEQPKYILRQASITDFSIEIPAGAERHHKHVTFGEQTSQEMLFTFARFRFKGETTTERHDEWFQQLQMNVSFGALDDNIDGKLTAAEFRNDPRFKPLVGYLSMVDADKDGALSKVEMGAAIQMMRKMRQSGKLPPPKEDAATRAMKENATGG